MAQSSRKRKFGEPSPFTLPSAVKPADANPMALPAAAAPQLPPVEEEKQTKFKKRKKRRFEDQTWNPRGTGHPGSALNFRRLGNGWVAPMVDRTKIANMTTQARAKVEFEIAKQLADVKNVELVAEVLEWNKGLPIKVKTESGKIGYLATTNGIVYAFSETPQMDKSPWRPKKTELTEEELKQIAASSPYQAIRSNEEEIIYFEFNVTKEQLRKAQKEFEENNFKRVPNQQAIVVKEGIPVRKGNATNYGVLFIPDIGDCEWLHKIAHSKKGNDAQEIKNLGCGTFPANTNMMHVEMQDVILLQADEKGYWITGAAHYIPKTKMFTFIDYTIKVGKAVLPFTFNCQDKQNPNAANLQCVKIVMDVTIKLFENNIQTPPQNATKHMVLFTPKIPGRTPEDPVKNLKTEMDEASDKLSQASSSSSSSSNSGRASSSGDEEPTLECNDELVSEPAASAAAAKNESAAAAEESNEELELESAEPAAAAQSSTFRKLF